MTKSGFVSIIGRPNSGKSTLLNRLVGEKISIVTDKPQTTRRVLRGILTRPEGQITFLDTPGIHKPIHRMNERMMSSVRGAMADVDLILLIVDASTSFGHGDEFTLDLLKPISTKKILLLNKIDRIQAFQRTLRGANGAVGEVEIAVVLRCACPSRVWITSRFTPSSRRCVAKAWRSEWG